MDAIEAVLDLAKERDALADDLDVYEKWFESLVDHEVTLSVTSKKKTHFVTCRVVSFMNGEGWELVNVENEDEVYMATFSDIVSGKLTIH